MPESRTVDAHVYVGRNESRWQTTRPELEALGIDTAVLSADPESFDLAGDRTLPGDLSRRGGPYGLWYIGGTPFAGHSRGPADLPRRLGECDGIDLHCFFSDGYDYGSSDEVAAAATRELLDSFVGRESLAALAEAVAAGLPLRLTESLPVTLALVERFPEATFVIPHMGLRNGGSSRVLNALADKPRVHFDTSAVELNEGMVEKVGPHRVIFASGTPQGDASRALHQVRALQIPPADITRILGENALRLLDPDPRP